MRNEPQRFGARYVGVPSSPQPTICLALVLGVAKEYSADHDQAEQLQLLKDIFASREADHQLLASLLKSQYSPNGASASAKADEYQSLLDQREQLLQAAQKELFGTTGSGIPGAGPLYRQRQNQIRDLDLHLEEYNKRMAKRQ